MRLADSSFLLALFLSGDRNFAAADREAAKPEPILVLSEVLGETLGVLQKRKGIDFARLVKQWIEGKPHFQFAFTQRSHFDAGSRIFMKAPERLNYVDAIVTAWAVASSATVLTYDEDLRRALRREVA